MMNRPVIRTRVSWTKEILQNTLLLPFPCLRQKHIARIPDRIFALLSDDTAKYP